MVNKIIAHNPIIITNPPNGECSPKKNTDQKILKINCPKKIIPPAIESTSLNPFFHTKKKATAINRYKTTQTGPKTQLGGPNDGFAIWEYHLLISDIVKMLPTNPANWQTTIEVINLIMSEEKPFSSL